MYGSVITELVQYMDEMFLYASDVTVWTSKIPLHYPDIMSLKLAIWLPASEKLADLQWNNT